MNPYSPRGAVAGRTRAARQPGHAAMRLASARVTDTQLNGGALALAALVAFLPGRAAGRFPAAAVPRAE